MLVHRWYELSVLLGCQTSFLPVSTSDASVQCSLLTDSIEFLPDVDSLSGAEEDDNSSTDIVDVNDLKASLYEPEDSSSKTPSL